MGCKFNLMVDVMVDGRSKSNHRKSLDKYLLTLCIIPLIVNEHGAFHGVEAEGRSGYYRQH